MLFRNKTTHGEDGLFYNVPLILSDENKQQTWRKMVVKIYVLYLSIKMSLDYIESANIYPHSNFKLGPTAPSENLLQLQIGPL